MGVVARGLMGTAKQLRELLRESQELDKKLARLVGEHIDDQFNALTELRQTIEPED